MGHNNPDRFFNDPAAINPQTGQLLHPAAPPPDPKLLAAQARAQLDQATAAHKAELEQKRAEHDAIHRQVKIEAEIGLARIKAELDAKMTLLDAHLKAMEAQQTRRSYPPSSPKTRDGHHYIPDRKRPGKHLLVVHHG